MPGIKSLRQVNIAKEAVAGTFLKATTLWRGTGTIKNDRNVVNPVEDIGIVMTTDRTYVPSVGGTLTLEATPATFEQLPYLFECGVKATTGVADTTGSGYIYTYTLPTTVKNTINNYSIEAGDDNQVELASYAYAESIKLSGKVNAAIEMSGVLKTRTVAPISYTAATIGFSTIAITDSSSGLGVFLSTGTRVKVTGSTVAANNLVFAVSTGSAATMAITGGTIQAAGSTVTIEQYFTAVSIPAVEEILFNKGLIYIDVSTGTIGTTLKSQTFLSFDFDLATGWKGQPAGDGRLDFSFTKSTRPSGTLKVTFEHDGSASVEKAAWIEQTVRKIRIKVTGSALTTAGAAYTYKTLIIDVVGKWLDFSALEDDNGNDTVSGTLLYGYDPTAATSGQVIVVNQLSALP
jgi:hypothetical protein